MSSFHVKDLESKCENLLKEINPQDFGTWGFDKNKISEFVLSKDKKKFLIELIIGEVFEPLAENLKDRMVLLLGFNSSGRSSCLQKISSSFEAYSKPVQVYISGMISDLPKQMQKWIQETSIPCIAGADEGFDVYLSKNISNFAKNSEKKEVLIVDALLGVHFEEVLENAIKIRRNISKIVNLSPYNIAIIDTRKSKNTLSHLNSLSKVAKIQGAFLNFWDKAEDGLISILNLAARNIKIHGISFGPEVENWFLPNMQEMTEALNEK